MQLLNNAVIKLQNKISSTQTDNDEDMHKRRIDAMQDIVNYERRVMLILQDISQQYDMTINNSNDKLL